MNEYVIAFYSDLDGLDQIKCEALNEYSALSFALTCKGFNVYNCEDIDDLYKLVKQVNAKISVLPLTN